MGGNHKNSIYGPPLRFVLAMLFHHVIDAARRPAKLYYVYSETGKQTSRTKDAHVLCYWGCGCLVPQVNILVITYLELREFCVEYECFTVLKYGQVLGKKRCSILCSAHIKTQRHTQEFKLCI